VTSVSAIQPGEKISPTVTVGLILV